MFVCVCVCVCVCTLRLVWVCSDLLGLSACNSLNPVVSPSLPFSLSSHIATLYTAVCQLRNTRHSTQTCTVDASKGTSICSTHCRHMHTYRDWVVKAASEMNVSCFLYLSAFLLLMCEKHALTEAAGERELGLNCSTNMQTDSLSKH